MLLLFAPLGPEKPLSVVSFRNIKRSLEALGPGKEHPQAELSKKELLRLGVNGKEATLILKRLGRERELERHLSELRRLGIVAVTRVSAEYPRKLRRTLGEQAPMLLYCKGNLSLLETECVSLVGSRQLREPGRQFARQLGCVAAEENYTYVSGGAIGADSEGFDSAMASGGNAVLFLADSLKGRMRRLHAQLKTGRLLLVSEFGYDQSFSVQRAYSRNRLIHAMGQKVFVAQTDYAAGGTWNGVVENLKAGWSPVYMCATELSDMGTRGLLERGCYPVMPGELQNLRHLEPDQMSLF